MGFENFEIKFNNIDSTYLQNMFKPLFDSEQLSSIKLFNPLPSNFCTDTFMQNYNPYDITSPTTICNQTKINSNIDICSMYFNAIQQNQNVLANLFNTQGLKNIFAQKPVQSTTKGEYTPSQKISNKQSNEDYIKELNPTMQTKVRQLMAFAESNNIPFRITSGYRTREEQLELIEKYKNQPGRAAGADTSPHRFGRAIDIRVRNLSEAQTTKLGNYAKSIGLRWGGDFRTCRERWHFDIQANKC